MDARLGTLLSRLLCLLALLMLNGCDEHAWNDPYPKQATLDNTLYTAFSEQPKHLDPAKSYSANEWTLIAQIYEPPLEYNYLKRPYELQPLTATELPETSYNASNNITTYRIKIKPQIFYQRHPAFAKDATGNYRYHKLTNKQAAKYRILKNFTESESRELLADDYVYQIKRLADPKLNSPIFGFLSQYIVGFNELHAKLAREYQQHPEILELDKRTYDLAGVKVIDQYTYEIKIQGKYPQFKYWLAMPFFAAVPWEATIFYAQPGLAAHNITLDWYPIGTGPYFLAENNPERRMVMRRNVNYHADFYPSVGDDEDRRLGLLASAGQKLPFLDTIVFSLEKENIPYWDKFLQGYYDSSGISSDNFASAIRSVNQGGLELTKPLLERNIRLAVSTMPSIFYWGFNMLDDTVGGYSEPARKLRKAISLAFDMQEYIDIFTNGRGIVATGPIPPGIFGYQQDEVKQNSERLVTAKQLLAEAGYPDGRHISTGEPLQINFEAIGSGDPEEKSRMAWLVKQFAKLGIDLIVRTTDYNRFQDKMTTGNAQLFSWGWNADYPDPENFLYMFYGPNSKVKFGGENAANYYNPLFDSLFVQFKALGDSPERLKLIQKMVALLQEDSPWIWGYYPQSYALYNTWYGVSKPNGVANNTLKYIKIDPQLRAKLRLEWNKPLVWPFILSLGLLVIIILPAIIGYRRSEKATGKRLK